MKRDISTREDVVEMVDTFYAQILKDDTIGHFFTEVVQLNFEAHLPTMYDFWETTLLGNQKYKGNPMLKHIELSQKSPLNKEHFERWLQKWEESISGLFAGPKSEEAITRANQIGQLMLHKINQNGSGLLG